MHRTVVINVVGLSKSILGEHTPFLREFAAKNHCSLIRPLLPAVTTTMQSCYVTGKYPDEHGIVGNGWYDREECEIKFWKQSNHLVKSDKIWHAAKKRNPSFTCSKMFWWYNMYSDTDYSVTPRPQYHADGVKKADCYSYPAGLRDELQEEFGTFPLFDFWGPRTSIRSSEWIANSSMKIERDHSPTLTLIYLPHLDYCLQKFGVDFKRIGTDLRQVDALCQKLVDFYENRGVKVILLSEYGIGDVQVPVHVNRVLREEGLLQVRKERNYELLDAGASKAFAVADHQVAHIYLNDQRVKERVRELLELTPGIRQVLDTPGKRTQRLDHDRAGDLVAIAGNNSWFTYYYWKNNAQAPDFAKTVDIHRKPGYDPLEMFFDEGMFTKAKAAYKLLRKKLGFRYSMDVISLDPSRVKGSHGSIYIGKEYYPLLLTKESIPGNEVEAPAVYQVIWKHLFNN